jgi:UDP-3-O-[3-hydroxymyristoyl] glucosamine N-acyltransferase
MITMLESFETPADVPEIGVHASAVVHPSARIGPMTRVGAQVSIGPDVVLGSGVVLHPGVRLYRAVQVGDRSTLHANTVVRERCVIGRGVILHQNVSIGADGFGYRPAPDGRGLLKMPHIGTVRIEDDVEIGANSCVDRAKFGATVVGAGTKIDNLCQIGHNCRIGRACVIAGNAGLAGSVTLGDGVVMGGGGGVREHLTIGSGARIGALTLVTKNVPPRSAWLGIPADEAQATLRQWASVRKLPSLLRHLASARVAAGQPSADGPDGV